MERGAAAPNYYSPPDEQGLAEDQFVLSLDDYAAIFSQSKPGEKAKRNILLVGLAGLLAGVLVITLDQSYVFGCACLVFALLMFKARFTDNRSAYKEIYDSLEVGKRVVRCQFIDDGIRLEDGRGFSFLPAEDLSEIVVIDSLAILKRGGVGFAGIALRSDFLANGIRDFKAKHGI